MSEDDSRSLLLAAIDKRRAVDFKFAGTTIDGLKPYVLYNEDGILNVAGMHGDNRVRIPVDQIKDLTITPRYFEPDPTFTDPKYDNAAAIIKGV